MDGSCSDAKLLEQIRTVSRLKKRRTSPAGVLCSSCFSDMNFDDFWQQFLNTLDQIQSKTRHLSTLREINSTDQTVKLLTDGHGFGPHPSAAGSSKRHRLGEAEERGGDGETEKLQKKEEGNIKEAEKNERGDNEEVEKLQH
ncbi:unnamed protein product [Brassica rapa subsp. narinosa]